jgi:hypothetical protein
VARHRCRRARDTRVGRLVQSSTPARTDRRRAGGGKEDEYYRQRESTMVA